MGVETTFVPFMRQAGLCIAALGANARICRGQGRAPRAWHTTGRILGRAMWSVDSRELCRPDRTEAERDLLTESNLSLRVAAHVAACTVAASWAQAICHARTGRPGLPPHCGHRGHRRGCRLAGRSRLSEVEPGVVVAGAGLGTIHSRGAADPFRRADRPRHLAGHQRAPRLASASPRPQPRSFAFGSETSSDGRHCVSALRYSPIPSPSGPARSSLAVRRQHLRSERVLNIP